jgi:hypothetical protein
LLLEPLKNVLIDTQRNRGLGRQRFEAAANNASNDVLNIRFGML